MDESMSDVQDLIDKLDDRSLRMPWTMERRIDFIFKSSTDPWMIRFPLLTVERELEWKQFKACDLKVALTKALMEALANPTKVDWDEQQRKIFK